jgi:hypothetical protein
MSGMREMWGESKRGRVNEGDTFNWDESHQHAEGELESP